MTLKFAPELKPYLLGLKEFFTSYKLENAIRLTGKYSFRLYEVFKCNEFKKTLEFKLSDLTEILVLGKSYRYFDIKRQILETAKRELTEKTDIIFDYEEIKCRKKVVALKFHIRANPKCKKPPTLPEPQKLLEQTNNSFAEDEIAKQIAYIQSVFQKHYKGELETKFVRIMLEKRGHEHVLECLRTYKDYINGQNIRNIAGHFFKFVIEGYTKPVAYKGKIPQRDNFDQREYTDEQLESYYANLKDV